MILLIAIFSILVFIAAFGIVKRYDAESATWFILTAWCALALGLTLH